MAAFTVHIPNVRAGETVPGDKIVFLRDGFSWAAFFFGPLWLAWRRAWLAALLWTLLLVLIALAVAKLGVPLRIASTIGFASALMLGFEGSRLVAWTLGRKGYSENAVIIGEDIDEAEEVFFRRWRPESIEAVPPSNPFVPDDRRGEAPGA